MNPQWRQTDAVKIQGPTFAARQIITTWRESYISHSNLSLPATPPPPLRCIGSGIMGASLVCYEPF